MDDSGEDGEEAVRVYVGDQAGARDGSGVLPILYRLSMMIPFAKVTNTYTESDAFVVRTSSEVNDQPGYEQTCYSAH